MKKSKSKTKNGGIQTEPKLTEPEMNAALQLIQLSGDSDSSREVYHTACDSSRVMNIVVGEHGEEESVGDTAEVSSATAAMNMEETFDEADRVSPPKKRKFRSISALYQVTKPLILKTKHRKLKIRN